MTQLSSSEASPFLETTPRAGAAVGLAISVGRDGGNEVLIEFKNLMYLSVTILTRQ